VFSTIAYSDELPFRVPGVWQNQGLSYSSFILLASRVIILGTCLLPTYGLGITMKGGYASHLCKQKT